MKKKKNRMDSKEVGLVIGQAFGKYLLGTNDLHYGYWPDDLPLNIRNIAKAQENHSDLIIRNIPAGAKTVLDVGCGAGSLAKRLLDRGFNVDCVSPSPLLSKEAMALLGDRVHLFQSPYETLETDQRYDVIIFSESYQYIDMDKSFSQSVRFLNDGGSLLICDFFKTEEPGKSAMGGGHRLTEFYRRVAAQPFTQTQDIDITRFTAPNLVLVDDMLTRLGIPVRDLLFAYLKSRYPLLMKLVTWKFRRRIDKINGKYFSGRRTGENFAKFKSYRLMVYRRK